MTPRFDVLIDGTWEFPEHVGAEPIVVRNPWDGSELGAVPSCDAADVRRAVVAARRALADGWPQFERAALLDRLAEHAADPDVAEGLARTVCTEAAKPITTARVEVQRFISTVRFSAAACRALAGEMVPMQASAAGAGKLGLALAVPVGVVGAISPFNFPLNLVAHKVAPAIAAGCPVVLKPASATPLSAIALARLLDECGLPPGWLNVVTGGGGTVGNALVDDPDVAYISFTGSVDVGWGIRARAPRKKTGLELGSTAPLLVAADGDWATAAKKAATAAFSHAGQSCISTQRIYVDRAVAAEFTDALATHVTALVVGDPLDPATDVSAVISTAERDRVRDWIDEAVAAGARIVCGGDLDDHGVLRPTVLADVTPTMKVSCREVFGPVVSVVAVDSLAEAVDLANDSDFGLQAGVFTRDIGAAFDAALRLEFGGVLVNEVPTFRADQQPYGGVKDSGNTREGPAFAVREMTEIRFVGVQLD